MSAISKDSRTHVAGRRAEMPSLAPDVVGFRGEVVHDRTKPDGTPRKPLDLACRSALAWQARTVLRDGIALVCAAAPFAPASSVPARDCSEATR